MFEAIAADTVGNNMACISEPTSEKIKGFSLIVQEAGPSGAAAEALVARVRKEEQAQEEREKWMKWCNQASSSIWDTESDDKILLEQSRVITNVWKGFMKKDSLKQVFKAAGLKDLDESNPPTIDTLFHVIKGIQDTKDAKGRTFGEKVTANIRTFACDMNAHKHLFSVFPNESIYTSILSGVVSSLVVACANYEKAAEGFSEGLKHISNDLSYLSRSKKSLNTPPIRKAIAAAYAEVFKFLCSALDWRTSRLRRIGTSIQGDFYEKHVKAHTVEVRRLADNVEREIGLDTHDGVFNIIDIARSHNTAEQQKDTSDISRRRDDTQRIHQFDVASEAFGQLGYDMKHCLVAAEQQHDYDLILLMRRDHAPGVSRAVSSDQSKLLPIQKSLMVSDEAAMDDEDSSTIHSDQCFNEISDQDDSQDDSFHAYARTDLDELAQSVQLDAYVNNGISHALRQDLSNAAQAIPSEVLQEVQQWMQKPSSSLLWLEGPVLPTDLAPTAIRVWGVFSTAKIPCVPFFTQLKFPNPRKMEHRQAGVICMLYTLIRQLMNQLPPVIESEEELGKEYFTKLDGSWESASFALSTVRQFLRYAPPSLVVVIHGLETLESKETRSALGSLIDIFREQAARSVVKVLFTTNGMCRVLGKKTTPRERVDASRMAQGRPGRLLKGSSSLRDLSVERPK